MYFMKEALIEAKKAYSLGEVPVGAVIVKDNQIIARGHNMVESLKDPTAHSEIFAIKEASKKLASWRLHGCDLYVTLEPCPMCAGAIVQARLDRVFFAARDQRKGCCGTVYDLTNDDNFNHKAQAIYMEDREASQLLSDFFSELRNKS